MKVLHLCKMGFSETFRRRSSNQRTLAIGGKYHCMADLLFDWFGFDKTSKTFVQSTNIKATESKQNKQEVSHTVILPLKLVFSVQTIGNHFIATDEANGGQRTITISVRSL